MEAVGMIIVIVGSVFIGYSLRDIIIRVGKLEYALRERIDKKPEKEPAPQSAVIDPLDPVQEALYEQKKMQERLNAIK